MRSSLYESFGKQYVLVESFGLAYQVEPLGLFPVIAPKYFENYCPNLTESLADKVTRTIKIENENIRKIAKVLNLPAVGEGEEGLTNFISALKENPDVTNLKTLNLSGLGLTCVPFVIRYFEALEFLDLSNNNFGILAPDLVNLRNLKIIHLEGNRLWEHPDWLVKMSGLQIFSDINDESQENWAQLPL